MGLGAPSLAKDTDGESLVLLFIIPGLLVNILVWKLIRSVCVAITLLLSDSCNKDIKSDTAKLYWLTSSGSLEGVGINNVSMRGIAIQSAGGFVTISGLDNNETVSFYGIDGKALGTATAINDTTSFAAQSGSIVVAKIGKENIKIAVE